MGFPFFFDSTMKLFAASSIVGASASWDSIVESVNAGGHSWVAEAPAKFASPEDVKVFLGAILPGDERLQEPAVIDLIPSNGVPASFDSAEKWPQCTVIGNVRDQSSCGSCWAFGSTESFESRSCITSGNDVKHSPEDTAFCSDAGYGCEGGYSAWSWFMDSGVVTGGDY